MAAEGIIKMITTKTSTIIHLGVLLSSFNVFGVSKMNLIEHKCQIGFTSTLNEYAISRKVLLDQSNKEKALGARYEKSILDLSNYYENYLKQISTIVTTFNNKPVSSASYTNAIDTIYLKSSSLKKDMTFEKIVNRSEALSSDMQVYENILLDFVAAPYKTLCKEAKLISQKSVKKLDSSIKKDLKSISTKRQRLENLKDYFSMKITDATENAIKIIDDSFKKYATNQTLRVAKGFQRLSQDMRLSKSLFKDIHEGDDKADENCVKLLNFDRCMKETATYIVLLEKLLAKTYSLSSKIEQRMFQRKISIKISSHKSALIDYVKYKKIAFDERKPKNVKNLIKKGLDKSCKNLAHSLINVSNEEINAKSYQFRYERLIKECK